MRQLLLDLLPDSPPSLDNFVPGGNLGMTKRLSASASMVMAKADRK